MPELTRSDLIPTTKFRKTWCCGVWVKDAYSCGKGILHALGEIGISRFEMECDRTIQRLSLLCPHFDVYGDYNPLQYIFTAPKLDATRLRWVSLLADFKFKVYYKPGRQNQDADGLSRMPLDVGHYTTQCTQECSQELKDPVLSAKQDQEPCSQPTLASEARDQENTMLAEVKVQPLDKFIQESQLKDKTISTVISLMKEVRNRQGQHKVS